MAKKLGWSLDIKTGVEVEQKKLSQASRILDAFYDKYNDQKMQVDASDLISTVRDGVSALRELYNEGTSGSTSWLNIRPEMKAEFERIFDDAETMFSNIKVLFSDGSYVSGLHDISDGFRKQLSIVFSDVGGLYEELDRKQHTLVNRIGGDIAIQDWYDEDDLQSRIKRIEELIDVQKQLLTLMPYLEPDNFSSGSSVDGLRSYLDDYKSMIEYLRDYNLSTVQDYNDREAILADINSLKWSDRKQNNAKENGLYNESIEILEDYIKDRQNLLEQLDENEYRLFSVDGIGEYKSQVESQIESFKSYKNELETLRDAEGKGVGAPVNLTEVTEGIGKVEQAVRDLIKAFEPLTTALSAEDSALHKLVTSNIEDLNVLETRLKEVYSNIEAISKKDFNVTNTNVLQQNISNPGGVLKAQKDEAKAMAKELGEWLKEFKKNQKALAGAGIIGMAQTNLLAFDPQEVIKGINSSKNETQLYGWIDTIDDYKNAVLDAIKVLEKHGYKFNLDSLMNAGKQDKKVLNIEETTANVNGILTEVQSIRDRIQSEIGGIRQSFEDIFKFDTIEPDYSKIQSITDKIYSLFEDLQSKINKLGFTISGDGVGALSSKMESRVSAHLSELKQQQLGFAAQKERVKTGIDSSYTKTEARASIVSKLDEVAKKKAEIAKIDRDDTEKYFQEQLKLIELQGDVLDAYDRFSGIGGSDKFLGKNNLANIKAIEAELEDLASFSGKFSDQNLIDDLVGETGVEKNALVDIFSEAAKHGTSVIDVVDQINSAIKGVMTTSSGLSEVLAKIEVSMDKQSEAAKTTADSISSENAEFEETKKVASDAAIAKGKFTEENKKVSKSANDTVASINEENEGFEETSEAAQRVATNIQNAYKQIDKSVNNKPFTINGTSYEDFQNFALELASSNNMKIDDVSVISDGNDQAKLATVKMVNEELAQSIVYTYELKDAEDDVATALLRSYKASSNVNKATKLQLAAQKRADSERKKNNAWLIKQQSKLDTQERRYKHSNKPIDGATQLTSVETSLPDGIDNTIDNLTQHIRNKIKNAMSGNLTDAIQEEILNDIRILDNEIAIARNDKYSATNMKASSVETNVKAYKEFMRAFEANAKKSGVFEQMQSDIASLNGELDEVTDSDGLNKFIDNLKVARNKLQAEKSMAAQETSAQKENKKIYDDILAAQDKIYDIKKKMVGVDLESAKGMELARKLSKAQAEYNEKRSFGGLTIGQLSDISELNKQRQSELNKLKQEQDQKTLAAQEAKDLEYVLSLYKKYADAQAAVTKLQNDSSGAVHAAKIASANEDLNKAKQNLLDIGIDIDKISESELLTEKQKTALLEEQIRHEKAIRDIRDSSVDKLNTKAQKETDKKDKENQKYGKTIYNREKRYADTISGYVNRYTNDDGEISLDDKLIKKIKEFNSEFKKLEEQRAVFENDPNAANDSTLTKKYQDAAIKVTALRTEILETFKASQKLENMPGLIDSKPLDVDGISDVKTSMIEFAAELTNGTMKFEGFNDAGTQMYGTLDKGAGVLQKITIELDKGTNKLYAYESGTKDVANSWERLGKELTSKAKSFAGMYLSFNDLIRVARQGVTYVKEIDSALTELKKVTDESEESYKRFLNTMSQSAGEIGSTVKDLTTSAADWARLGYSIQEAGNLAKNTAILMNVSEFDNITNATDTLVSALQAYKDSGVDVADLSMDIINKYNEVGNSFAISTSDLANSLTRSSATLVAAGNSLSESIAMTTAANATIQDPNAVGNALKVVAMRIRGTTATILEEMGEDAEGLVESTSKLQEKVKALTTTAGREGINILADDGSYKSTYQILLEISRVFDKINDKNQAALLELLAGKQRGSVVAALLQNGEMMKDVFESSEGADNSAMHELETYLDSIQGRIDIFNNSVQTLWMNIIDSEWIKGLVDSGTDLINFLDSWAGRITAVVVAMAALSRFKGHDIVKLGGDLTQYVRSTTNAMAAVNNIKSLNGLQFSNATEKADIDKIAKLYGDAVSACTPKIQANVLATAGLTKEQAQLAMRTNGLKDEVIEEALAHTNSVFAKKQVIHANKELTDEQVQLINTTLKMKNADESGAIAAYLSENATGKKVEAIIQDINATDKLDDAQKAAAISALQQHNATLKLGDAFKALWKNNPTTIIMAVGAIATGIFSIIDGLFESTAKKIERLRGEYDDLQSGISENEGAISSIDTQIAELQEQINALSNKNLTIAESEELKRLKDQTAELEKQKEIQEHILKARTSQNQVKSMEMIDGMLKTTAANQERNAENGKKWGSVLGGVVATVGTIAAILAAPVTGGTSIGAALMANAGTIVMAGSTAYGIGSKVGSWAGENIGRSTSEAGASLIEWYESYETAIEEASNKAAAAESKYLGEVNDDNYEKWQNKVEAVNTLQTEMYNGLEQLQEYVGNLEYNDTTKEVIDGYNDLMAHISIKGNDGDIDAQISAINSLASEYNSLSKGVDENGQNIALSADEYSRYQSVIKEILAYTPQLIQGYDDEGNAIINRNTLLSDSIELLKEQQRLQAADVTSDENISKAYQSGKNTYSDSKQLIKNVQMVDYHKQLSYLGTENIIEDIIGVERDAFQSVSEYIGVNSSSVRDNLENILHEAELKIDTMYGHKTEEEKAEMLNAYKRYINDVLYNAQFLNDSMEELQKILYTVPEASRLYDELSGDSINFINEYIGSFENLADKTESEILQIKKDILSLTTSIALDNTLQDKISELVSLDMSSMPVEAYREEFNKIWSEIEPKIPEEHREQLLEQLFPDQNEIDTMILAVQNELVAGSRDLVNSMSLEELRIAYKLIPEYENDENVYFSDLMQKVSENLEKTSGPIVQTYSALKEQAAKFDEIATTTAETVMNNTVVTQEYKDALLELGISQEDLNECFDSSNALVVTNSEGIKDLIDKAKKGTAQNVKLAKSQARLQYYELYKEMRKCLDASGNVIDGNEDLVVSYGNQMNAIEKTIAKYSVLEHQLLGATTAYDELAKAQEADAEFDYGTKAAELVNVLGDAFNKNQLGTQAAQTAIKGLVPDEVIDKAKTLDEQMDQVYKYFTGGPVSKLFTIEFDDEGEITDVKMTEKNVKAYAKSLMKKSFGDGSLGNIFQGTWDEFTLNPAIKSLEDFADVCGVTEEVAFAFLTELEKYDINWLGGDYSTFLDQFLASTNEGAIQLYTEKVSDLITQEAELAKEQTKLDEQLKKGLITQKQYDERQKAIAKDRATIREQRKQYESDLDVAKETSKTSILGGDGYAVKTSAEIRDIDIKDIDNYIDAQLKVNDILKQQEEAKVNLAKISEEISSKSKLGVKITDAEQKAFNDAKSEVYRLGEAYVDATAKREEFEKPGTMELSVVIDDIDAELASIGSQYEDELGKYFEKDSDNLWVIKTGMEAELQKDEKYQEILRYVGLLNSKTQITAFANTDNAKDPIEDIRDLTQQIVDALESIKVALDPGSIKSAKEEFNGFISRLPSSIRLGVSLVKQRWDDWLTSGNSSGTQYVGQANGTAHSHGTAYAGGSWGAQKTETALTGELGPELLVRDGKWQMVGENGAEFRQIKKGDIIFNHKQTESLLKNGYVTGRGKAYASGTLKNAIMGALSLGSGYTIQQHIENAAKASADEARANAAAAMTRRAAAQAIMDEVDKQNKNKSSTAEDRYADARASTYSTINTYNNSGNNLKTDYGNSTGKDAASEFEEVFDWVEVRLEEINEQLDLMNAQLENAANFSDKNSIIDNIIGKNEYKIENLRAGIEEYSEYAEKLLAKVPKKYQDAVQSGMIDITEFSGKADEATVEAINNYREWAQKVADLRQQLEETNRELRDLYIQKIDNAQHTGDVKATIEASQTDKLQSAVDLQEESGLIASSEYYAAMAENSRKTVEYLSEARREMQKEFNDAVADGSLIVGSDEWYENLDKLYQIDAEIDEAVASLEEFQNAINDIYWAHFDYLINRLDYISEDTQSLIDLMDSMDMISKPEGAEWWTADDVKWTKEGMASLGLHAQEMERAEERAKMYAIAIDDLTAEYEAGHYSESEYLEKLNELTQGQYEAIEKAQDEKEAIVELNEARVDAIKEGIELEIEAYEELIEKKKEELDSEKDLYDFQKSTTEQSKNIADIQRKLAALSVDNSASAAAKRRQLEAELAEANAQLEETYYERSISNKQNALDKELEDFKTEKDAEITKLEEYLTNVEQVVTDSLTLVRANAEEIGATLTEKTEEYNLTVSDAVLNPWRDGALAIDEYTTKFGDTASSTINQLNAMRDSWLSVRSEIEAANKALDIHVSETEKYHSTKPASVADINKENAQYAAAQKKKTPQTNTSTNTSTNKNNSASQSKAITVGGKINAGSAKIYSYAGGTGVNQYYKNDPIYTVLAQHGEWLKVRHHKLKSGVTGWFKKGSVKAYAKGSLGVDKDQLALIDELGEELVLHANNGKLSYLSKGTGVIPSDITSNLMEWGALDPQEMIDRNRPSVGISPEVHNTEVNLTITYGDMVSIEEYNGGDIAELEKMVKKQFDKHTKDLNNAIRKYTR